MTQSITLTLPAGDGRLAKPRTWTTNNITAFLLLLSPLYSFWIKLLTFAKLRLLVGDHLECAWLAPPLAFSYLLFPLIPWSLITDLHLHHSTSGFPLPVLTQYLPAFSSDTFQLVETATQIMESSRTYHFLKSHTFPYLIQLWLSNWRHPTVWNRLTTEGLWKTCTTSNGFCQPSCGALCFPSKVLWWHCWLTFTRERV